MTMRISPIGPLSGSGGAIEKTMQSCGCSAINVKTENEERGGGRERETNLDPEPRSLEPSDGHVRINRNFASK